MLKEVAKEIGKRYPVVGPMVTITFKKEGINALKLLYNLKYIGVVRFNRDIVVHALVGSGDWEGNDSNRVVEAFFPLGAIFKNETFLTVIAKDIESIRLATHHEVNGLMTGRKKLQEDLANKHLEKITAPSKELTKDEAREVLKNWLEAQGYERDKILTSSVWFKGDNINFEVMRPYGLFKVNKITGEVEDNYGYFSAEKADDHDQTACHCRFCSGVTVGESTK